MASLHDHKEVVETLLSAKVDVNHQIHVCDIYDCCDECCFLILSVICEMIMLNRQETMPSYWLL